MERVEFTFKASKYLGVFWSILSFCFIVTLLGLSIPILLQMLSILLLGGYTWKLLELHVLRHHKNAIVKIWQDEKGRWGFQTHGGHYALGHLEEESYITPLFILLCIRLKTRKKSVLVPVDALKPMEYRVLCSRLRFQD